MRHRITKALMAALLGLPLLLAPVVYAGTNPAEKSAGQSGMTTTSAQKEQPAKKAVGHKKIRAHKLHKKHHKVVKKSVGAKKAAETKG